MMRSALLIAVVVGVMFTASDFNGRALASDPRANIFLVITDDLDDREGTISDMENLHSLLTQRGVTLEGAYATQALCCPSRASILRGQYPHNTGVTSNRAGEYADFVSSGKEKDTFATWIQSSGYQTAYFGKYLNGYGSTRIPAGWDRWFSDVGRAKKQNFNDDGELVSFDPDRHLFEDVLRDKTLEWLETRDASKPFLAVMSTHAPHTPAIPARRHANLFGGAKLPKPAGSFNEQRVSDKNGWIRRLPRLSRDEVGEMERLYRNRLRVMEGVDEMLGDVLHELGAQGELGDTYVFFTSDNGYHFGEHRFHFGKETSYEEDIAVPMIVSGPGVATGESREHIVLNQDLAATFAEIAGAPTPDFVDGRSFLPLLDASPPADSEWRDAFLVNSPTTGTGWLKTMPRNQAVRTPSYSFIDYASGKDELYDMNRDLRQTQSIFANPPGGVLPQMRSRLEQLRGCKGEGCRSAEGP